MMGGDSGNYQRQNRVSLSVQITMASGATMRGSMFVSRTRTIHDERQSIA